ncbi:MAG: hypothetical protein P8Y23_18500, partial [Candidatus Lokiarchaeota archaeon]
MDDKSIPKYQIREKTPQNEIDTISNQKLLKKIKDEQTKLIKERIEWEKVLKKVEDYGDDIDNLEKKRKEKEYEVRKLIKER